MKDKKDPIEKIFGTENERAKALAALFVWMGVVAAIILLIAKC